MVILRQLHNWEAGQRVRRNGRDTVSSAFIQRISPQIKRRTTFDLIQKPDFLSMLRSHLSNSGTVFATIRNINGVAERKSNIGRLHFPTDLENDCDAGDPLAQQIFASLGGLKRH